MSETVVIAGVDVSQDWLDVYVYPLGHARRITNNAEGMAQLVPWLASYNPAQVACEATGGLERLLVKHLQKAGMLAQVINPSRVSAFRQAAGWLAKTDMQDAQLIAIFASRMSERTHVPLSPMMERLKDYGVRRRQLVDMQTQERNRLKRAYEEATKRSIRRVLALLQKEREKVENAMLTIVKADQNLNRKYAILTSIPSIGPLAALTILSEMPELGNIGDKQAAALAGLAPANRQSGKSVGRANVRGGRRCVRSVLYMSALTARAYNPAVAAFYQRLVANGKPRMVALIASMRKLLIQANRLLAEDKLWKSPIPA